MRKFQQNKTHFLTYKDVFITTEIISELELNLLQPYAPEKMKKLKSALMALRSEKKKDLKQYGVKSLASGYGYYENIRMIQKNDIKNISDDVKYNKVSFTKMLEIKKIINLLKDVESSIAVGDEMITMISHKVAASQILKSFKSFAASIEKSFLIDHAESFNIVPSEYKNDYIVIDSDFMKNLDKGFYALVKNGDEEGFIGFNRNVSQQDLCWHAVVRDIKNAIVFYDESHANSFGYGAVGRVELDMRVTAINAPGLAFAEELSVKIEKSKLENVITNDNPRQKTLKV